MPPHYHRTAIRYGIPALLLTGFLQGCANTAVQEALQKDLNQCKVDLAFCKQARDDDAAFQRQLRLDLENQNASLKQDLDSTRKDMEAYRGQSQNELISCVDARHKLEADLETLRQLHRGCSAELNQQKSSLQELEDKTARYRDKLQSEISARNVEIENLRGQLSVHVLDKVLFHSGSAVILPEGQRVLDKLAEILATEPDTIRVEGHTDSVPIGPQLKEKYPSNWELSAARASSVVRYFEEHHKLDPSRLEAVGFSMYHPVTNGDKPDDLQRNRRVEIVLLPPRNPPLPNPTK
ncbi:MAG: OmpA family protein [Gammaproteobacteria bacterium]|nr:OmpA family protein [Gammaproteobacteria bacterium]